MPEVALVVVVGYYAVAFAGRSLLHRRRTGSTGIRGIPATAGPAVWLAGVLLVVALAAAALAPPAQLAGIVVPLPALDVRSAHAAGLLLSAAGITGTLWAQIAMGDAWRIGVDPRERTALVVRGPFRLVRNPIFTSMAVAVGGVALLAPNGLAVFAVAALLGALELQVRRVEEPHLLRAHGDAYRRYAARTGRFVPGVGRLGGARS